MNIMHCWVSNIYNKKILKTCNMVSTPTVIFIKNVYRKWSNKPPGAYLTKSILPLEA